MRTMAACLLFIGAIAAATTAAAGSIQLTPPAFADQDTCARHATWQVAQPSRSLEIVESESLHPTCGDANVPLETLVAIDALLAPCDRVPDGFASFAVHLMPDGRILLTSPSDDPNDGLVPTCALRSPLRHELSLEQSCRVEVTIKEP
jgi:hypothetical protein